MTEPVPPPFTQKRTRVWRQKEEAVTEAEGVRMRELHEICEEYESLNEMPRSHPWRQASQLCLSSALGACLAIPLLFDKSARFPGFVVPLYVGLILLLLAAAGFCRLAIRDMESERNTSLKTTTGRFRRFLESFELVAEMDEAIRADEPPTQDAEPR